MIIDGCPHQLMSMCLCLARAYPEDNAIHGSSCKGSNDGTDPEDPVLVKGLAHHSWAKGPCWVEAAKHIPIVTCRPVATTAIGHAPQIWAKFKAVCTGFPIDDEAKHNILLVPAVASRECTFTSRLQIDWCWTGDSPKCTCEYMPARVAGVA